MLWFPSLFINDEESGNNCRVDWDAKHLMTSRRRIRIILTDFLSGEHGSWNSNFLRLCSKKIITFSIFFQSLFICFYLNFKKYLQNIYLIYNRIWSSKVLVECTIITLKDDLIDPVGKFRHIGVDQIIVQVANFRIFTKYFNSFSSSHRDDFNHRPLW